VTQESLNSRPGRRGACSNEGPNGSWSPNQELLALPFWCQTAPRKRGQDPFRGT